MPYAYISVYGMTPNTDTAALGNICKITLLDLKGLAVDP